MAKGSPTARTPQERENQLVSKAYDLVERRIDEGTASSQETTHFLKLGSTRGKIEEARLLEEVKLVQAKTEALAAVGELRIIAEAAVQAMTVYRPPHMREEVAPSDPELQ